MILYIPANVFNAKGIVMLYSSWQYLHLILYTIKTLCTTELAQENPLFTVDQFKSIKTAIEVSACIGIIPSLLPQVKTHANSVRSRTFKLKLDDDSITEVNCI